MGVHNKNMRVKKQYWRKKHTQEKGAELSALHEQKDCWQNEKYILVHIRRLNTEKEKYEHSELYWFDCEYWGKEIGNKHPERWKDSKDNDNRLS